MSDNPYSAPASAVRDDAPSMPAEIVKKIRRAAIAGCMSGVIILAIAVLGLFDVERFGDAEWMIVDALLIFGLAYGIHRRSRVCAVLMLGDLISSKILIFSDIEKFSGAFLALVFLYYYALGIQGCFQYHQRLREAHRAAA